MEITRLLQRSVETLKDEGAKALFWKTKYYLSGTKNKEAVKTAMEAKSIFGDVLFINGCYLPHPVRYRVAHQQEQLFANGVISEEVFYTKLTLEYVKRYRVFIFYRCPYTEMVGKFIEKAKSFHKVVLFDVDDLVIDTRYTDSIPYLSKLSKEEKKDYDNGVRRMQKTLRLCDAAITTTEGMAKELRNYVSEVFINRNTASDEMCFYSKRAVFYRDELPFLTEDQLGDRETRERKEAVLKRQKIASKYIKIGYFSGSITHNDDIQMLLPVLVSVMRKYKKVHLYFVGELDLPTLLKPYQNRIHCMPVVDWKRLPEWIARVDINLVPLRDTVFNEAKSENKWVEAALVKVPTIASRVGAFEKMIVDGKTGILCSNEDEWKAALEQLIEHPEIRTQLACNAWEFVNQHCTTICTGVPFCDFIRSKMTKNIAFVLPSMQISGGVQVVMKHCAILKKAGYDVMIINDNTGNENIWKDGEEINVLSSKRDMFHGRLDYVVGTLWATMDWVNGYQNIGEREYLVQNYETEFYEFGNFFRFRANQSYSMKHVRYITISTWCRNWLKDAFGQDAAYVPNGLECDMFPAKERRLNGRKIRILVEGNSEDYYKNVDESFQIIDQLDPEKFEVWYMSYQGKPKKWYRVDEFLHQVPYRLVPDVYRKCDILLKSSLLESFSYPPLEMMATGGYVVVRPNDGNQEYLRDGENCILYDGNNLHSAVDAIYKIVEEEALQKKLFINGLATAKGRDWKNYEKEITKVYFGEEQEG